MKYILAILVLVGLAFSSNISDTLSDTIWTAENEFTVENYLDSKIDNMKIHISNDYYRDFILVKEQIIWSNDLSLLLVDSMTVEYYEGYHYVFTWRAGIVHTQIAYFDSIQEINTDEDTRKVVKQKVKSNIVRYNSYEVRTFCNRIVELYYLDSEKVYSVYTEMYCNEPTESEPDTNSTHHYLNPIG